MIEIRLKDIDPDTGIVSQDILVATAIDSHFAELIMIALVQKLEDDPNREFYTRDQADPNRELTHEERVAWFISNYYETGMEYEGLVKELRLENLDEFKWYDEIIRFPRTYGELKQSV